MENVIMFIPHIIGVGFGIIMILLVKYGKTEEEIKKIKEMKGIRSNSK